MSKLTDQDVRRILTEADWRKEQMRIERGLKLLVYIPAGIAATLSIAATYLMLVH